MPGEVVVNMSQRNGRGREKKPVFVPLHNVISVFKISLNGS